MLNDYTYRNDPDKARDSRWVHRPYASPEKYAQRSDPDSIEGRIFEGLQRLIRLRKSEPAFSGSEMQIMQTGNDHVFGYVRVHESQRVLVLANFSEAEQTIPDNLLRLYGLSYSLRNLLEAEPQEIQPIRMAPYQLICLGS
jgi:glycosidase